MGKGGATGSLHWLVVHVRLQCTAGTPTSKLLRCLPDHGSLPGAHRASETSLQRVVTQLQQYSTHHWHAYT